MSNSPTADAPAPRDAEKTHKLFDKYKPTHVIHLAALGESFRDWDSNLLIGSMCSWRAFQEYEVQGAKFLSPMYFWLTSHN